MLDCEIGSPVSLQGASCTTGGILYGNAYSNKFNHADFEHDNDDPFMLIQSKQTFRVFVYVQYGDVLAMNRIPDFDSQIPITVFFLNDVAPLTQAVLKKAVQYHNSISRKSFFFSITLYLDIEYL